MKPGVFIVIDGSDGSGKQTQTELLVAYLQSIGISVLSLSFPRYEDTFFGRILRKALDGVFGDFVNLDAHLASVFYALDRWESRKLIMHTLVTPNKYVVCDRYVSANQIHQGGKIKDSGERITFLKWLDSLEYDIFKIPRPDICIYLDVPPAVSEKNMSGKVRDEVEKNPEYLESSHQSAQWLVKQNPQDWIHVRCTERGLMRTREEIHQEVVERLRERQFI